MTTATLVEAREWAALALQANGACAEAAQSAALALAAAEADGLKGHGLSRLPTYVGMLKSGKIDGQAVPAATRPRPGVLAIDAACGFAYPAIDLAISELPALARQNGIALAAIRRSNHAGALGLPVERLADAGLVALMLANTPEAIAPWGGKRAVFGTNPIAFAAPLAGKPPVVIDLALSKVARGNIVAAKQKGEPIPEGWALDKDGKPTTDPDAALAGTMIAMGDAKGAALAMMVEVMAGALVGAHLGFEASSFLDEKGAPPETGQIVIAIDPGALGTGQFAERITTLAAAIEGQEGARMPGSRRSALRRAAAEHGIEIPQALIAQFGPVRA
jgi:(2R)-3-sulfolactate dehydrogenase (NADP+)